MWVPFQKGSKRQTLCVCLVYIDVPRRPFDKHKITENEHTTAQNMSTEPRCSAIVGRAGQLRCYTLMSVVTHNEYKPRRFFFLWSLLFYATTGAWSWALLRPEVSSALNLGDAIRPTDADRPSHQVRHKALALFLLSVVFALFAPVPCRLCETTTSTSRGWCAWLSWCVALVVIIPLALVVFTALGTVSYQGMDRGEVPVFVWVTAAILFVVVFYECAVISATATTTGNNSICNTVATFVAIKVLETTMAICTLVLVEWALYNNITENNNDDDDKAQVMHVHHWQYGAVLACVLSVDINDQRFQPCSLNGAVSMVGVLTRYALIAITWHGVWAYGPDPTFAKWQLRHATAVLAVLAGAVACYVMMLVSESSSPSLACRTGQAQPGAGGRGGYCGPRTQKAAGMSLLLLLRVL